MKNKKIDEIEFGDIDVEVYKKYLVKDDGKLLSDEEFEKIIKNNKSAYATGGDDDKRIM